MGMLRSMDGLPPAPGASQPHKRLSGGWAGTWPPCGTGPFRSAQHGAGRVSAPADLNPLTPAPTAPFYRSTAPLLLHLLGTFTHREPPLLQSSRVSLLQ